MQPSHGGTPVDSLSALKTPLMPRYLTSERLVSHFVSPILGLLSEPQLSQADGKLPGIICFGGSEGGLYPAMTRYLASHGAVTLTVAYLSHQSHIPSAFSNISTMAGADEAKRKWDELPQNATMISLERFEEPIKFLQEHPQVDPRKIVVTGTSYGGMLTLALAAHFRESFAAAAAWVPNSCVLQGTLRKPRQLATAGEKEQLATETMFSIEGKNYPRNGYISPSPGADIHRARIPVENITVPVFAVSGEKDPTWYRLDPTKPLPDNLNAEAIGRSIRGHKADDRDFFKNYPDNGHCFLPHELVLSDCNIYQSRYEDWYPRAREGSGGKDEQAIMAAAADAWSEFWQFFRRVC